MLRKVVELTQDHSLATRRPHIKVCWPLSLKKQHEHNADIIYAVANLTVGFPCGSAGKESACNAGDLGLIPGLGRFPEEGKGYPSQYSGLRNSTGCIVHGGRRESDTTERLSLSNLLLGIMCLPDHSPECFISLQGPNENGQNHENLLFSFISNSMCLPGLKLVYKLFLKSVSTQ